MQLKVVGGLLGIHHTEKQGKKNPQNEAGMNIRGRLKNTEKPNRIELRKREERQTWNGLLEHEIKQYFQS